MENQSAIKQSASMEKKMYGMFLKTPKIEKADPADLVEELKSSDPVIDLTVPNQPVSDSNFAKLNKDLNELIKIKQEEGKQPLLDILDQLTSSMMKEKSTKELAEKEDEPKKKHRPGPKFGKFN